MSDNWSDGRAVPYTEGDAEDPERWKRILETWVAARDHVEQEEVDYCNSNAEGKMRHVMQDTLDAATEAEERAYLNARAAVASPVPTTEEQPVQAETKKRLRSAIIGLLEILDAREDADGFGDVRLAGTPRMRLTAVERARAAIAPKSQP